MYQAANKKETMLNTDKTMWKTVALWLAVKAIF